MTDVVVHDTELLKVSDLDPVDWNPNEETDAVFTSLVDSIKQQGFTGPLTVTPHEGRYRIIAGEHRWRAAQVLGMKEVPCYVLAIDDEDQQKILTVRDNAVRGRLNPGKFTKVYNELANKYGEAAVRRMMGILDDAEFRKLYRDVRRQLPKEVRKKLDDTKREIASVEDLAQVVQEIMAESGSQLEQSFIVFSFAGKQNVLIRADQRAWKNVMRIAQECEEEGVDVNVRLNQLLEKYMPY